MILMLQTMLEQVDASEDLTVVSLLSIFGGVVVTVLAGLIGAWIQSRREHTKWRRDQRLVAYVELLAATDNYLGAAHRGDEHEMAPIMKAMLSASARARLLGPASVYTAAVELQDATRQTVIALETGGDLEQTEKQRQNKRDAYVKAAQKQVGL
jgi:hypothetical protein